ncbi:putative protein serine/threonine kinase [Cavenderia fasciculata]|uniref:non-specific serine/threonine protein kinase n=1 Tax=Cavenderia fasciculata TaxID=261658 RepID=F4QF13_CACFS|nr:putative protein serine/threonine kinase [Cavenderia fasciculata]EGG13372.1 putative protein serine/threonine kinase [Cavenderia fasciculata]|eukprot:XP_004350076.1 putative protein serine/threonine kinase [Cavenderia fasciculata]
MDGFCWTVRMEINTKTVVAVVVVHSNYYNDIPAVIVDVLRYEQQVNQSAVRKHIRFIIRPIINNNNISISNIHIHFHSILVVNNSNSNNNSNNNKSIIQNMDYSPPQYSPRSTFSDPTGLDSPRSLIDSTSNMTDYYQQPQQSLDSVQQQQQQQQPVTKDKSNKFGWIGNLLSRKKSNSTNSLYSNINQNININSSNSNSNSGSENSSNNNSNQNSPTYFSNQHVATNNIITSNYSPSGTNGNSNISTANNSTSSGQAQTGSTKRRSIFQFFSIFQYNHRADSSSSSPSTKTSLSPLKRFKFTRTSSSTSIDTKSVNKKHMLQSSHSCNNLNINYISTKHELNQFSGDPSSLLLAVTPTTNNTTTTTISTPPTLLTPSGSATLLPMIPSTTTTTSTTAAAVVVVETNNQQPSILLPPIPTIPILNREDSSCSMASSNDEDLDQLHGSGNNIGKYAILIPTPIPSPIPHLQDVSSIYKHKKIQLQQNNQPNNHHYHHHQQQQTLSDSCGEVNIVNTGDLQQLGQQQQPMTCRISSQCEESILNRTISSIDIMEIAQQGLQSNPTTPAPGTPTLIHHCVTQMPPIINLPSTESLNSAQIIIHHQQDSTNNNQNNIDQQQLSPRGLEQKAIWHSPAKIKSQLQTRTSAPQLGVNSSPMLQTSYSNPKIGTHHWWGSNNPIPNEQNKMDLQMQFLKQQEQKEQQKQEAMRTMSDNQLLSSNNNNHNTITNHCNTINNNNNNNLVRAASISKWVSAAPSSPPPMAMAPRGSNSPDDQSSPERCMSPISSMIRVYYIPLTDDEEPSQSSSGTGTGTTGAVIEQAELKVSNTGLPNNTAQLYWSHIVVQHTSVKDVIEHVSSKVDKPYWSFKLCCSLNPYDFLDDTVLLIGFRLRRFYLIEVAEEMIVHDNVECNVFANMFPAHANYFNNTSTATISSSMLGSTKTDMSTNTTTTTTTNTNTTSSSSLSASCAALANPLSSSWSPSYCKFLSTSSKSFKRTQLLMSVEDTSPVSSLEDNDDFLLDLPSSPCSYQANPLFSLSGSGSRLHSSSKLHQISSNGNGNSNGHVVTHHHHHHHHKFNSNGHTNNQNQNNNTNQNYQNGFNKYLNGGNNLLQAGRRPSLVEQPISMALKERIKILDNYFNHYYRELENYLIQRSKRMETLKQVLLESGIRESSIAWGRCVKEHLTKETTYLRSKRARIGPSDFQKLTAIGKGGFGKVYLARKKDGNEIVTLKVIRKNSYHRANQMTSVSKEKAVMMIPHTHKEETQWITRLLYSFHDSQYLYLAMEYHCGGDFRALLNNLTRLEDDIASFYMAEMVLAIQSLHKLGYIHRDIKPSNFVVDKNGHLKLIDFGLSKEGFISRNSKYQNTWRNLLNNKENDNSQNQLTSIVARSKDKDKKREQKHEHKVTYSKVGSPEYMAPEMLTGKGYDMTYDYWSLGVVFFEMLFGETPFGGDTPEEVFKNIMDWKTILDWNYLSDLVSSNALDLLKVLLCDPEKRTTGDDLKKHIYFEGLDWDNVHKIVPPFVPQVQNELDTSYFEGAEELESDADNDYDEVVEAAQEAAEGGENQPDQSPPLDEDTSFRNMPFGGFNFQRFPSVVEGARVKGLIKSFYVENEKCVSRATSTSSLNSPNTSCANSPIIQSQNSKTQSFNNYHPSSSNNTTQGGNYTTTPSQTPPTPTSPNVHGYQPKTPILRVSSKSVTNSPQSNLSKK